eukprot:RCo051159
MLSKVLSEILLKQFGRYVEGLDSDSLHVGVLHGICQATDLAIRPDALSDFDIPFDIRRGHLGLLRLKVPWRRLTSDAVEVEAERLFVVLQPRKVQPYSSEEACAR